MKCHNCKYFTTHKLTYKHLMSTEDDGSDFGTCLHEKIYSDVLHSWMDRNFQKTKDSIVSSCDEERSTLEVGRDFGCIHFELKN